MAQVMHDPISGDPTRVTVQATDEETTFRLPDGRKLVVLSYRAESLDDRQGMLLAQLLDPSGETIEELEVRYP